MSLFNFLKRKKAEKKEEPIKKDIKSRLRELCNDEELSNELYNSLLLNPTYFRKSSKEMIAEAKKLEKAGNKDGARSVYEYAGDLALYEKNVRNIRLAFDRVAGLSSDKGKYASIRKNPEKAIEIVTKIYQEELKPVEEKK